MISMPCDPVYTTLAGSVKLVLRAFLAVFVGYNPRFSGPGRISMPYDPRYTNLEASAKLVFWPFMAVFVGYNP